MIEFIFRNDFSDNETITIDASTRIEAMEKFITYIGWNGPLMEIEAQSEQELEEDA